MKKTNRKLSVFEIVWYSITGAIGLWGLTFIILGVVARNLRADAGLAKADASFGMGYLPWGAILLAGGVILAVIVLLINAKQSDREVEKQQRRAARLAAANSVAEEPKE